MKIGVQPSRHDQTQMRLNMNSYDRVDDGVRYHVKRKLYPLLSCYYHECQHKPGLYKGPTNQK